MSRASDKQIQSGSRGRQQKTRDRIVQTARELFNEQGEASVTLADIGEHLGISEGNVWYHFHTKRDLITTLLMELQEQIRANQLRDLDNLSQIQELQVQGFHLMWEYRFLFRDHINWVVAQQEVHEQLAQLTSQGQIFLERVLERLRQLELLQIQKSEISTLATNIWIITRYWIDYCQARNGQRQITEQDVQEGIHQVRALLFPYLTSRGRQILVQSAHQAGNSPA